MPLVGLEHTVAVHHANGPPGNPNVDQPLARKRGGGVSAGN